MNLSILNFRNKKALSPLITVVLLIVVAVVFTVFIMSWAKSSTHKRLSEAEENLRIDSELECRFDKLNIESCTIDYVTKDINLLISNPSDLEFSGLTLSIQGKNIDGQNMKLVGKFIPKIKKGEVIYLSTGSSSDFQYTREDYNHSLFDVNSITNFTIGTITCPNNYINLKYCEIVNAS